MPGRQKGLTCLLRGDFRKSVLRCPGRFPGRWLRTLPGWLCSGARCFSPSILSWRPGIGVRRHPGFTPGWRGVPTVGEQWSMLVFWDRSCLSALGVCQQAGGCSSGSYYAPWPRNVGPQLLEWCWSHLLHTPRLVHRWALKCP